MLQYFNRRISRMTPEDSRQILGSLFNSLSIMCNNFSKLIKTV